MGSIITPIVDGCCFRLCIVTQGRHMHTDVLGNTIEMSQSEVTNIILANLDFYGYNVSMLNVGTIELMVEEIFNSASNRR